MTVTFASRPFTSGFYSGGARSTEVPDIYDVALDGVPFLLDTASKGGFRHQSITITKDQSDTSASVGEHSINPNGVWRRSVETWHRGAGQRFYDRADSDPARFHASKSVDCWTRGQLTLHNETDVMISSDASTAAAHLAATATRLFLTQDTTVRYIDSVTNTLMSQMTGSHTFGSITTDGFYVYATDGSDVYRWLATDTAIGSAWNTLDCTLLRWVKGRLMAANNTGAASAIYNITSSSVPTALTVATGTFNAGAFTWVDFAAGHSCIYAAGYQGDKSLIFRIAILSDATGLDVAVPAADLPDGEIVRSVYGYLGFVLIGTDNGVRLATANASGDLTVGALIETPGAVRCFEGQGRFVWFGVDGFGLYRLDLSEIVESAPAYATDLVAATSGTEVTVGNVYSVDTFLGVRVFAANVSNTHRAYVETSTPVPYGFIDSGIINFGIPEDKTAITAEARFEPLDTITADEGMSIAVAVDGASTFTALGSSVTNDATGAVWDAGQNRASSHEIRLTILSDTTAQSLFPELA